MLKYNIILAVLIIGASSSVQALSANNEPVDAQPVAVAAAEEGDKNAQESPAPSSENTTGFSGSYLSSQFSRSSGDMESAIKSLEKAYRKSPQNSDIANQLMGLYLLNGDVDKAMEIASKISEDNAKEPISALMLSLRAIKNNDIPAATKILDTIADEEGGQLWLPLISAWLDVEQRKLLKPLMVEELSAEVGRAAPIVNYHLALINARAGFIKEATENFKHAVEESEQPPTRVMQMLIRFYDQHKSPASLKPIVTKYLEANKNNPSFNAKQKLPLIDNVKDGAAEILLTMGSIMLAADVTQDATLYLQLTLYLKPDMEIATLALAQAYSELQQYGIANELLVKIPKNSPLYNTAQLYTAINLGQMKKIDEAIVKLDALIAQSPDSIDGYMAKGDLLRVQEKYAEAISVYQQALKTLKEEKSQHWPIFFAIGTSYDKQGNWQEAEKNLKHSLELSPNQPDVLNYLGYSYIIHNTNLAKARELIEKAIKKRPGDPQIIDSMGWVLYLLKDYKQSVEYLERAVSLLPADVTVNEHLGDVYWRLGRKNEARFQWDRAVTYSKDDEISDAIRKKIKDGLPDDSSSNAEDKKEKPASLNAAMTEQ